jgi:hypothetical protein
MAPSKLKMAMILSAPAAVLSVSSGLVTACDAWDNFGCLANKRRVPGDGLRSLGCEPRTFPVDPVTGAQECNPEGCCPNNDVNKWQCMEDVATKGLMPWAHRPYNSEAYSLRTRDSGDMEDDDNTYVPGSVVEIHIRVLDAAMKYRGLLINAVNSNNETVGDWQIESDGTTPWFMVPETCSEPVVVHAHAGIKPYHSKFYFVSPKSGGDITFRALIKRGPANTGEFYYPINTLVITERSKEDEGGAENEDGEISGWFRAGVGQTCDDFCADEKNTICNAKAMKTETAEELTEQLVSAGIVCKGIVTGSCSNAAPAFMPDQSCTFHPKSCKEDSDSDATVCSAAGAYSQQLCRCPGSNTVPGLAVVLLLALGLTNTDAKPMARWLPFVGLAALAMAPSASAHNWMMSPARNANLAAASRTCSGRKASDTHAQVGPNQHFLMQYATGHDRNTILVVMKGGHENFTHVKDYLKLVDRYIDNAPTDLVDDGKVWSDISNDPQWQRVHAANGDGSTQQSLNTQSCCTSVLGAKLTGAEVGSVTYSADGSSITSGQWTHPRGNTRYWNNVFRFQQTVLNEDRYVAYHNPDIPWIEAAARYAHHTDRGSDLDSVRIRIPGRGCDPDENPVSCHYVVHWYWSGYSDCADVDYFHEPVAADKIYGTVPNTGTVYIYNRDDHCEYDEPLRDITQCAVVKNNTIHECIDRLEKTDYFNVFYRNAGTSVGNGVSYRFGVNLKPAIPPANLAFPEVGVVPWHRGWCANGPDVLLQGTVTRKAYDWGSFDPTTSAGTTCSVPLYRKTTTFRGAVSSCTADQYITLDPADYANNNLVIGAFNTDVDRPSQCFGFSGPDAAMTGDKNSLAEYEFTFCGSAATAAQAGATSMFKKAATLPPMPLSRNGWPGIVKISFGPTNTPLVHADGTVGDANTYYISNHGQAYGPHQRADNGETQTFGWNCRASSDSNSDHTATANVDQSAGGDYDPGFDQSGWVRSIESTYTDLWEGYTCPVAGGAPTDGPTGAANDDDRRGKWEIEVPNGVYKVVTTHNDRSAACRSMMAVILENARMPKYCGGTGAMNFGTTNPPVRRTYYRFQLEIGAYDAQTVTWPAIEVTDGRLTLSSPLFEGSRHSQNTQPINTMTIEKIGEVGTQTPPWVPTTSDDWWQMDLGKSEPIGLVQVTLPGPNFRNPNYFMSVRTEYQDLGPAWRINSQNCRSWWFFTPAKCGIKGFAGGDQEDIRMVAGPFSGPNTGAVISVSDKACSGGSCPAPAEDEICAVATYGPGCNDGHPMNDPNQYVGLSPYGNSNSNRRYSQRLCPLEINCQGKEGRYVRIELPGAGRHFEAEVNVNRAYPDVDEQALACWGVEARLPATLPEPKFETRYSEDAEDSAFYGTCYRRETKIDWLPTGRALEAVPVRVNYNGYCLTCDSFDENGGEAGKYNFTEGQLRNWQVTSTCEACNPADVKRQEAMSGPITEDAAQSNKDFIGLTGGVGVTIGVIAGMVVGALVLGFVIAKLVQRNQAGVAHKTNTSNMSSSFNSTPAPSNTAPSSNQQFSGGYNPGFGSRVRQSVSTTFAAARGAPLKFRTGQDLLAQYSDGMYYKARVISADQGSRNYSIVYTDYNENATLHESKLRMV